MSAVSLQIPEDAAHSLKLPPGRAEEELRREFAVFLVKEGLLDRAPARRIARMERVAFDELLARRRVPWGGSPADALRDLDTARAAAKPAGR
ncbi:UPF0175 family protein [Candidatus Thiosymbion oneisti]|uniref:UPF0175 family protein n=1 Tax=Candidatus Thiosymbion oneisti TaxID=589554 RepID=UPI00105E7EF2|nr:UPF0175 family protein [Candidatus Thiosymbion oneisti]